MRIICPTYWYPQHVRDTQATYVHDINRHLVRRGHVVTVVTPGDPSLPREEVFDGVKIVRFPFEPPPDLTYGRVAQSQVSWIGRFARLVVMAHYLEAQYRAILDEAREKGADVVHAHWAIPTGPAAVLAARKLNLPSLITMHGGDVYVNPEQGYDFPTRWYIRPVLRWTLRHARALTAITEDCRQHALRAGQCGQREPDECTVSQRVTAFQRVNAGKKRQKIERLGLKKTAHVNQGMKQRGQRTAPRRRFLSPPPPAQ